MISIISQRILSPWSKKILNSAALKCSRIKDFHRLLRKIFTKVEENFELYSWKSAKKMGLMRLDRLARKQLMADGLALVYNNHKVTP